MSQVWFNGQLQEAPFLVDTSNRAFRYGDGLFETVRVVYNRAPFLHQHYIRFIEGMDLLRFEIPEHWSFPFLQKELDKLVRANDLQHARVRMTAWREGAGTHIPEQHTASLLMEAFPLEEPYFQLNKEGLLIGVYSELRKEIHPLSSHKSANARPYVQAAIFAAEQSWDDALILNTDGRPADAVQSSIFCWKNETLCTTADGDGGVDGVMRRVLLKAAKQWGMPFSTEHMSIEELQAADEIFLTNTMQGIRWVGQWGDRVYDNRMAGILTGKLNEMLPLS